MTQDFEKQLEEQLAFLGSSAKAYDDGNQSEAKRLATSLQILLHDKGRIVSLLTHLKVKDKLPFIDTANGVPHPEAIVMFDGGLCSIRMQAKEEGAADVSFHPPLGQDPQRNSQPRQCFEDWWETPILHDQEGNAFARRSLVTAVRDQDGGAHVDAKLEAAYEALTRGNSMGLTQQEPDEGWDVAFGGAIGGPPSEGKPISNSIALASIRQIAYEVQKSLEILEWDGKGHAKVANPICQHPFQLGEPTGIGRNDSCPCDSGLKFKKCFLAKKPRAMRS